MNGNSAPKRQSRLKQLALFVCIGFLSAASILFTSDWRQQIKYVLPIGMLITLGLLLMLLLPAIYLDYIRKRKAAGRNVVIHRILFCIYWFPFFPWAFAACIFGALYLGGIIK
jgi:hypothetical protein